MLPFDFHKDVPAIGPDTASASTRGHLTPRHRIVTSIYPAILVLLLAGPPSAISSATTNVPDWSGRAVTDLTTTNVPPPEPVPPPPPAKVALERLSAADAPTNQAPSTTPAWSPPAARRMVHMESSLEMDETDVDRRLERIHVAWLLEEATRVARRQNPEEALNLLQSGLDDVQEDDHRFALHQHIGALYFRGQEYEQAAQHMQQALEIRPYNAGMASNLAAVQMTLGEEDDALDTLTAIDLSIVHNQNQLFAIHFNMACLYSLKQETPAALDHLYRAAEAAPASVYASLGDPQLDGIRRELRFQELRFTLDSLLSAQAQ